MQYDIANKIFSGDYNLIIESDGPSRCILYADSEMFTIENSSWKPLSPPIKGWQMFATIDKRCGGMTSTGMNQISLFFATVMQYEDQTRRIGLVNEKGFAGDFILEDRRFDQSRRVAGRGADEEIITSIRKDSEHNQIIVGLWDSEKRKKKIMQETIGKRGLHLMELSTAVCEYINKIPEESINKMIAGMEEFDLFHLPFEEMALRFQASDIIADAKNDKFPIFITVIVKEPIDNTMFEAAYMEAEGYPIKFLNPVPEVLKKAITHAVRILLVAMQIRNIRKHNRLDNKSSPKTLRGLTTGPGGITYLTRTILEVPPITDMIQCSGSHSSPIPHVRIGHKHTFRYGKNREFSKEKFIKAIFVNGDPTAIPTSKKYIV